MPKLSGIALPLALVLGCAAVGDTGPVAVVHDVAYGTDPRQVGDLYRPRGVGPAPAVLLIHGGSWMRGDRSDMEKFAERFAAAGFTVFNVNYRLAPDHRFPAQLDDVRAAFDWLHGRAATLGVDPDRIAAMGYSAGAHLALLLALCEADGPVPAAVASGAGPTDLRSYPNSPVIRALLGGGPDELPMLWERASPIVHVSPGDPPVVIYHGTIDAVVGIEQSRRLHDSLLAHGVVSELIEERWAGHSTAFLFDDDAFRGVLGFLETHLR